jgi:hypothetical protein
MGSRRVIKWNANTDRNVRSACNLKQLCDKAGRIMCIPGIGDDELNVKLGAAQKEGKRPNIINIETDIGIKYYGYRHWALLNILEP